MSAAALIRLAGKPAITVALAVLVPVSALVLIIAAREPMPLQLTAAAFVGLAFGVAVGTALGDAGRCPYSWTLPGFRRMSAIAFAGAGCVVLAWVLAVAGVFGTEGASLPSAMMALTGFTFGGAMVIAPEGVLLFALLWLGIVLQGGTHSPVHLESMGVPLSVSVAAGACVAAFSYTFSARTWRWAAQTPGSFWDASPRLESWRRIPWWPGNRSRLRSYRPPARRRPAPAAEGRERWHRAVFDALPRPFLRRVASLAGITSWLALVVYLDPVFRQDFNGSLWFVLPQVGLIASTLKANVLTATYPWSRVHHFRVAYLRQLGITLWFTLLAGPVAVVTALVTAQANPGEVGHGVRIAAAAAVFMPLGQLVHGPEPGVSNADRSGAVWRFLGLMTLAAAGTPLIANGLPLITSSPLAQSTVLGILLAGSQVLFWRYLQRHFRTGDLVGKRG